MVGDTTDRMTGVRPQLVFMKQIASAMIAKMIVHLRRTCSCSTLVNQTCHVDSNTTLLIISIILTFSNSFLVCLIVQTHEVTSYITVNK